MKQIFTPFCSYSNPNSLRRMSVNMSAKANADMAVMNKRLDVLARKEARIQVLIFYFVKFFFF